jgi:hypothetical protein
MVTGWRSDRRGTSTTGCLLTLLLFSAVLYYGVNIGEVYWRFYQLQEEMRSQARLAPSLSDGVIRRRILVKIDQLGLPTEAERFKIERVPRPRQIVIHGEYQEDVQLPFFNHTFTLKPRAVAPL